MKNEFIPYEEALALKKLGFDEITFCWYHKSLLTKSKIMKVKDVADNPRNCKAPLYQQAFRWFREKYRLDFNISSWTQQPMDNEIWDLAFQYFIKGEAFHPYYQTYEEAELECLRKLIEIVKEKL